MRQTFLSAVDSFEIRNLLSALLQFLLRLSFGLSAAMAVTNPRLVTSGYYRNNLYIVLGLNVLAALIVWNAPSESIGPLGLAITAAVLSYFGAALWLYERPRPGIVALVLVALVSLTGAWLATSAGQSAYPEKFVHWLDVPSSGLLLGATMAAMLLGHWYLNAPGMKLRPLQQLILLMAGSVALRMLVCGTGLALYLNEGTVPDTTQSALLTLRWLAGLIGPAITAWMSWKTLEIPNTQSATGILYVGVIGVFLGETIAALLSGEAAYPL